MLCLKVLISACAYSSNKDSELGIGWAALSNLHDL